MKSTLNDVISVVISAYNVADYIEKCVRSVMFQLYKNLDIIIIDDGSDDGTQILLDRITTCDSRIRLIHAEHSGIAAVRQVGIEEAVGKYIGFVDGDDWIYSDMYLLLYENLLNASADVSSCCFEFDEGFYGSSGMCGFVASNDSVVYEGDANLQDLIVTGNNSFCNKLFKKSLLSDLSFQNGRIYEDAANMYIIMDRTFRHVRSRRTAYHYTYRKTSISNSEFSELQFDIVEAYSARYKYFSAKYSGNCAFVRESLKILIETFLNCVNEYLSIPANHSEKIESRIRNYCSELCVFPYTDCGLSSDSIRLFETLLKDVNIYRMMLYLINSQRKTLR
jgi:glycosyltransferase involved in cell wall biosynthesis